MSNTTSDNPGSGQRRGRSRGGRNRNRNRNRNQQGNRQRGDSSRDPQGGNPQGGRQRQHRRAPKPKPLTWWQKLLKAIGLYKEPTRPQRDGKSAPKSKTRDARSGEGKAENERPPREPRRREPRDKDREPAPTGDVTTKRVYLGNLSYEATESDLEELFRGVGTVRRVEIVYNRRTHRSKGYGFIEMLNVDEAKRAVEILHDQFFMGRKLTASGAKSQGPADGTDDEDETEDTPPTAEESQPPAEPQDENGTKPE